MSYLSVGLENGLLGPTFIDLTHLLNTDIKTLSYSHITGNAGYLVGCVACGLFSKRYNLQLQVSLSTSLLGLTLIISPWMPNVYLYCFVDFIKHICMSYLDTILQHYLITIWNTHKFKEPIMQGMHCAWAVGATITPFLAIPFISDNQENEDTSTEDHENSTHPPVNSNLGNSSEVYAEVYGTAGIRNF